LWKLPSEFVFSIPEELLIATTMSQFSEFLASQYALRFFKTVFSAEECPSAKAKPVDNISNPLSKILFIFSPIIIFRNVC
jgi:hypothetical protein